MTDPIPADVTAISRIGSVPTVLKLVRQLTGLRFAAVARVTEDSWTACAVHDELGFGLEPGGKLDVRTTLCDQVVGSKAAVIIENASEDPVYCGHVTPKMYGFESYIAVPITRQDGSVFGTICALDPNPAKLKDEKILGTIGLFAELISMQLEAEDRHTEEHDALLDERETAALREQFIAVLGHDLRSPLASIHAGLNVLARTNPDPKTAEIVARLKQSCIRMASLIGDVLDFARGRLGGGIPVSHQSDCHLECALTEIVAEVQSTHPDHVIEADIDVPEKFGCDPARLGQMLSNLLSNALNHGDPDEPVIVKAHVDGGSFVLSVTNQGPPIPPEQMDRLFKPYSRPSQDEPQQGLGLGLYICSEIARAHGGTLTVSSTEADGTTFTFTMPVGG